MEKRLKLPLTNYLDSRIARAGIGGEGEEWFSSLVFNKSSLECCMSKSRARASSFFIQLDQPWKALTGESAVNYYQFRHRRLFIIDPDTRATHVGRIVIYDAYGARHGTLV